MITSPIVLSIVLPTYQERKNVAVYVPEIEKTFADVRHEIIIVDDNSTDGTREEALTLNTRYGNIRVVGRKRKKGIGSAIRLGCNYAEGEYILTADADMSFSCADMRRLYEHILKTNADLVLGCRHCLKGCYYEHQQTATRVKNMVSRMGNLFLRTVSGIKVHDFSANFRIIRRNAWKRLFIAENANIMLFETIAKAHHYGFRVEEIAVTFNERKFGHSKLNLCIEIPKYLWRVMPYVARFCWKKA
jgi:dolichol-phosphate mannosyltransferase